MPILKHAKKKLKQDKTRTIRNKKVKATFKALIKKAKVEKTAESLSQAFSGIDKATKKNLMHENKAARLKSALTKFVASDATIVATKKAVAKKTGTKKVAGKKTVTKKKSVAKKK